MGECNERSFIRAQIKASLSAHTVSYADSYLPSQMCLEAIQSLISNSNLRVLELRGNDLTEEAVVALGELVCSSSSLKKLGLEWTGIGQIEALSVFLDAVSNSSSLRYLDLRNTKLSPETSSSVGAMIRRASLQRLDLRWNALGDIGGATIMKALESNHTLLDCHMSGNSISIVNMHRIGSILERNRKAPVSMHTAWNPATDAGVVQSDIRTKVEDDFVETSLQQLHHRLVQESTTFEEFRKQSQAEVKDLEAKVQAFMAELKQETARREEAEKQQEVLQEEIMELAARFSAMNEQHQEALDNASRMSSAEAQQRQVLQNQIMQLQCELQNAREKYFNDLQRLQDKVAYEKNIRDQEKGLAAKLLNEKEAEFQDVQRKTSLDANLRTAEAEQKLQRIEEEKASIHGEMNRLRQQVVSIQIENEERFSEFEAKLRLESEREFGARLAAVEDRIHQLQAARDSLQSRADAQFRANELLLKKAEDERKEYESWLNDERSSREAVETNIRSLQAENDHLRSVNALSDQRIRALDSRCRDLERLSEDIRKAHDTAVQQIIATHSGQLGSAETQIRSLEHQHLLYKEKLQAAEKLIHQQKEDKVRREKGLHIALDGIRNALDESNRIPPAYHDEATLLTAEDSKSISELKKKVLSNNRASRKENRSKPELASTIESSLAENGPPKKSSKRSSDTSHDDSSKAVLKEK